MKNPYRKLLDSDWQELAGLGWRRLLNNPHGDYPGWSQAIAALPRVQPFCQLDRDAPVLGQAAADQPHLRGLLMSLHPWRKGPLVLGGVRIDAEWRSDWKWRRLVQALDLEGHKVLDIGCSNGYFGLRMLASGAQLVVGVDPTLVFVMQWLAMQKLYPGLKNYVLPLAIEDIPPATTRFDSVFSMGVLYHRRDPMEHLARLKSMVRDGGQIVLETLVLPGSDDKLLRPQGRYARMRNVHAVPTLAVLRDWLQRAGLPAAQLLDVSKTTEDEQHSTQWMRFESLREGLHQSDPGLTIEGYPAPTRAALLVRL